MITLTYWDALLVAVVSLQATTLAYMYSPRCKAFLLSLPFPFTVACLALGRPVDATNVVGLLMLLAYTHAVRGLHYRLRVPIIPAIGVSALGYAGIATGLAAVIPPTSGAFWLAVAGVLTVGVWALYATPRPWEPGHRTELPLHVKLPLIALVVSCLILAKHWLGGFMTVFPMVSLIAAYEARQCLWTICLQIPVLILASTPMLITCRLTQTHLGLGGALAVGWGVLLLLLLPGTWVMWRRQDARAATPVCAD